MSKRTLDAPRLARAIGCGIAIMWCLFLVGRVHAAPRLTAAWQGRAVVVTWSGAPTGSCLYLRGRFVPAPCGPSGRALLAVGGVDTAYAPRGGDQLALAVDTTRGASVTATVPMVRVILPLVVH